MNAWHSSNFAARWGSTRSKSSNREFQIMIFPSRLHTPHGAPRHPALQASRPSAAPPFVRPRRFTGVVLPAALAVLLAGCGGDSAAPAAADLPAAQVRLTTVRTENLPVLTEATGTVRPVQRARLAAKVMGTIEDIPVTLGQRVTRGDTLAQISVGEISARAARARSDLNAVRRDLERERTLLEKGASTPDTVKALEDRFAGAEAALKEAEVMMGYAVIRAPFDGVIARKLANAGDFASPGAPLLEIEELDRFEIEASLPDSAAARLTVGAPLAVDIPAADLRFTAPISEISSAADPQARTVPVKLAVPEGTAVRSGQFARIHIPGASLPTRLLPASAVSAFGQMERVYVASGDNRARLRLVRTGARRGEHIEILSGIEDGDRVIVGPIPGLRDGQPLEILP
jgi:membrane fusion protein, multidrug efflux system